MADRVARLAIRMFGACHLDGVKRLMNSALTERVYMHVNISRCGIRDHLRHLFFGEYRCTAVARFTLVVLEHCGRSTLDRAVIRNLERVVVIPLTLYLPPPLLGGIDCSCGLSGLLGPRRTDDA